MASVAAAKAALQRRRAAQEDHQPQPGMPIPSGLEGVFTQKEPDDANCFERARDSILRFFAHRLVHRIFLSLSVLVCVLLVLNGLLIAYAVLGLYLRVDNGWGHYKPDCVAASLRWNQTLHALYIPKPPGAEWGWSRSTDIMYCTANQCARRVASSTWSPEGGREPRLRRPRVRAFVALRAYGPRAAATRRRCALPLHDALHFLHAPSLCGRPQTGSTSR